jgi:hypothetical protein
MIASIAPFKEIFTQLVVLLLFYLVFLYLMCVGVLNPFMDKARGKEPKVRQYGGVTSTET